MICYLDKTFCKRRCKEKKCDRKLNKRVIHSAKLAKLPICFSDFPDCQNWRPMSNESTLP